MSIANRFWVWRNQIIDLWVPAGTKFRTVFLAKGPEFGAPSADFYDRPLSYDCFMTGPSDYDMPGDEIYCPCGATLSGWDGTAGHLLRLIDHHCAKAGHPELRHEP